MMRLYIFSMFMLSVLVFLFLLEVPSFAPPTNSSCPVNMIKVGSVCIDRYEASVWSLPPSGGSPRGTQYGTNEIDNYPCSDNGNDCSGANPIFAALLPGVTPSADITWFQAQQACFNVGIPTNAEWQGAAAGTPTDYEPGADDGVDDCNTSTATTVVPTGSRSNCVSNYGVFDMVGNLAEWVADWIQHNLDIDEGNVTTALYGMDAVFKIDEAPPVTDRFPAALIRGGDFSRETDAGVFMLDASNSPSTSRFDIGSRCAR